MRIDNQGYIQFGMHKGCHIYDLKVPAISCMTASYSRPVRWTWLLAVGRRAQRDGRKRKRRRKPDGGKRRRRGVGGRRNKTPPTSGSGKHDDATIPDGTRHHHPQPRKRPRLFAQPHFCG